MDIIGIRLSDGQLWLLAAASVCMSWLVAHRLTVSRSKADRIAAARASFRAAVMAELGSVYPIPNAWPDDIATFLKARFSALQSAVETFRPFVNDKASFDAAWLSFYNAYPTQQQGQWYHHYGPAHDPLIETKESAHNKAMLTFKNNVSRLLLFAERV